MVAATEIWNRNKPFSDGKPSGEKDTLVRAPREGDIVAHGSRLDESNYVELELRRDDYWEKTDSTTRVVATMAIAHPVFHYDADFDIHLALRNLYIEERDLAVKGLSLWAGSRMYRGDDIYVLDYWPLDNLNTLGGGAVYELANKRTRFALHAGFTQPNSGYFEQSVARPLPLNQMGATSVRLLDRQKFIPSFKASHILPVGQKGGVKGVFYTELHSLPAGERQHNPSSFDKMSSETGYVVGGQIGAFTGERDTHVNLFLRYARGLAAYGEFGTPSQLSIEKTSADAKEFLVALGGNWEIGPFGLMAGAYIRAFRNASADLDYDDVDEGIILRRPQIFFGESGGIALEGSYQKQQRGVPRVVEASDPSGLPTIAGPHEAGLFRFGVVPFFSPGGRGSYSRPHLRLIWMVTVRDDGAQALDPMNDFFGQHGVEHFLGFGAEWWFNSSSYGG